MKTEEDNRTDFEKAIQDSIEGYCSDQHQGLPRCAEQCDTCACKIETDKTEGNNRINEGYEKRDCPHCETRMYPRLSGVENQTGWFCNHCKCLFDMPKKSKEQQNDIPMIKLSDYLKQKEAEKAGPITPEMKKKLIKFDVDKNDIWDGYKKQTQSVNLMKPKRWVGGFPWFTKMNSKDQELVLETLEKYGEFSAKVAAKKEQDAIEFEVRKLMFVREPMNPENNLLQEIIDLIKERNKQ